MSDEIQRDYRQDKSTVYVDMHQLSPALDQVGSHALVKQFFDLFGDAKYWAFSNRSEDGMIISRHHLRNPTEVGQQIFPSTSETKPFPVLPERTAFVTSLPVSNQMSDLFGNIDLSQVLGTDLTVLLVAPEPDEVSAMPSLVLFAHAKAPDLLKTVLEVVKQGKISLAGKPLEFLEPKDYRDVTVQPIQFRLNFLLAVTGGYAVVDDYFVLSTTLSGLKSVIDTTTGNAPALTDVPFSADTSNLQAFIQPHLFVPELKRFLPIATVLLSLSGQKLDATLTRRITENLFPLESLGPISAEMNFSTDGVDTEIRIVLEK